MSSARSAGVVQSAQRRSCAKGPTLEPPQRHTEEGSVHIPLTQSAPTDARPDAACDLRHLISTDASQQRRRSYWARKI